jgi:hypothetical protein
LTRPGACTILRASPATIGDHAVSNTNNRPHRTRRIVVSVLAVAVLLVAAVPTVVL